MSAPGIFSQILAIVLMKLIFVAGKVLLAFLMSPAGRGTRLMPLMLAMPKEMIRVGVKPVIEHAIEVLKAGGIRDILIVVGREKGGARAGKRCSLKLSLDPSFVEVHVV